MISLYHSGPSTAHDCAAVLYVIDKMQNCRSVNISFCNCHVSENQIKALTDTLAGKDGKLLVECLNLSGNDQLTYEGLSDLLHRASCAFRIHLDRLDVGAIKIEPQKIMTLLASPSCQRLSNLNLSDNDLGVSGLQALENTVSAGWMANLKNLNLSGCLTVDADGLCAFIEQLESPYCFSNLFLQNNSIHPTGLKCLVGMVHTHPTKEVHWDSLYCLLYCYDLDLGDNPIGIKGIITVGEILGNCEQCRVDLSGCHLTEITGNPSSRDIIFRDLGQLLCQMTESCINCLCLDCNSFTGECIHILTGFIHLCVQLTTLSTKDCNITSDDIIQLLEIIAKSKVSCPDLCSQLKSWNLGDNRIDDRGVSVLIDHVSFLFPCVVMDRENYGINLDGNRVSGETVRMLEEKLNRYYY